MTVTRRPASSGYPNLLLLQQEINRLFERLAALEGSDRRAGTEWIPSVDVYECEGKIRIVVAISASQASTTMPAAAGSTRWTTAPSSAPNGG